MNSLKDKEKQKDLENLPLAYRKGIEEFININKILYSITGKYLTDTTYHISNNTFTVAIDNFNKFINLVIGDEEIQIDDLDLINVFYNLRNCFYMKEKIINL